MIGLPGRGKSYIAHRIARWLNWKGLRTNIFNFGDYRRVIYQGETMNSDWFDPENHENLEKRNQIAYQAIGNAIDWIKAHTSFAKPLHRFDGELELLEYSLLFEGRDTKGNGNHSIEIQKSEVVDVFLGFDEVFRKREDRSFGISFQPLRITFVKDDVKRIMYLIIDFKRASRRTNNKEWYNAIKKWVG